MYKKAKISFKESKITWQQFPESTIDNIKCKRNNIPCIAYSTHTLKLVYFKADDNYTVNNKHRKFLKIHKKDEK